MPVLTVSLAVSNSVIDVNQSQTLTALASNGLGLYNFSFTVYNSIGLIANYTAAVSSNTQVFSFQVNSAMGTGNFRANVRVADSNNDVGSNTISFTVNPALVAGTPTESNSVIDSGQSSLLTSHASGGTTSYSYKWYTIAGSTPPTCTPANSISGATSNTYLASPIATSSYAYQVTDSASTPVSICSSGATVTVNPVPPAPLVLSSFTASPTAPNLIILDVNQNVTFMVNVTGGSSQIGNYTYYYRFANMTGHTIPYLSQNFKTKSPSNKFVWTVLNSIVGNTLKVNVTVKNGANITNSTSLLFHFNPALSANPITPKNPSPIKAGDAITLYALNVSGGTPFPGNVYYYQWYEFGSCTTRIPGANESSYIAQPSSTMAYTYKVTDNATTPNSVCSQPVDVIVNQTTTTTSTTVGSTSTSTAAPGLKTSPFSLGNETGYYIYNLSSSNFASVQIEGKTLTIVMDQLFLNGTVYIIVNSNNYALRTDSPPVVVDPSSGYVWYVVLTNENQITQTINFEVYAQPIVTSSQSTSSSSTVQTTQPQINAPTNSTNTTTISTTIPVVSQHTQAQPQHLSLISTLTMVFVFICAVILAGLYMYMRRPKSEPNVRIVRRRFKKH